MLKNVSTQFELGKISWDIFVEDKTVTEDSIEISYDFLKEAKAIFVNWKIPTVFLVAII